ncbi:hypothetical protein KSS87_020558, partial [Heliosperma pusillum]
HRFTSLHQYTNLPRFTSLHQYTNLPRFTSLHQYTNLPLCIHHLPRFTSLHRLNHLPMPTLLLHHHLTDHYHGKQVDNRTRTRTSHSREQIFVHTRIKE